MCKTRQKQIDPKLKRTVTRLIRSERSPPHSQRAGPRDVQEALQIAGCDGTAATRTLVLSCRIACATGSPGSTRRKSLTGSLRGGAGLSGLSKGVGCSATVAHVPNVGTSRVRHGVPTVGVPTVGGYAVTDSWPTTKAWRPVGGGTATPSVCNLKEHKSRVLCGSTYKGRRSNSGLGPLLYWKLGGKQIY